MRSFFTGVAVLICACGPSSAVGTASPLDSADSCSSSAVKVNGYLYGGALGVQEGILRLRPGDPPLKILWANRGTVPPREMTISGRKLSGSASAVTVAAGWAATDARPTFPAQGPVTGYVSEIPTLVEGGCWTFRWDAGGAGDVIAVRVPER